MLITLQFYESNKIKKSDKIILRETVVKLIKIFIIINSA